MLGWDHYYKSYRDYNWEYKNDQESVGVTLGNQARGRINLWRRIAMTVQFTGFFVGIAFTALFAAANIDNGSKAKENSSIAQQPTRVRCMECHINCE